VSRGRLRTAVVALGLLLLAAALAGAICSPDAALRLAAAGLVLVGAVAFERWRYKRLQEDPPDGRWIATDERFIDPESGKRVAFFYDTASGERRYVALWMSARSEGWSLGEHRATAAEAALVRST
jgi:hypothetical protein